MNIQPQQPQQQHTVDFTTRSGQRVAFTPTGARAAKRATAAKQQQQPKPKASRPRAAGKKR